MCHGSTPSEAAVNAEITIALVAGWFQCNGLVLNAQKASLYSSHLIYAKKKVFYAPLLKADDVHISVVPEIRVLGITHTKDLKWSAHASRTQKSVVRMLGVLNRFGSTLNTDCRCRILQAFIMPKLTYALPV